MKFVQPRPFADPEVASRKIIEIANGVEAAQDGRIHIEKEDRPPTSKLLDEDFNLRCEHQA